MKISLIILVGLLVGIAIYDERMGQRETAYLHDDQITSCRPPVNQGERLVATLSDEDGGLQIRCTYHSTMARAQ